MKIFVKVKTYSKIERVEKLSEQSYKVFTSSKPVKGEANKSVIEQLADYFKIPKSKIKIKSGENSSVKVVEINK